MRRAATPPTDRTRSAIVRLLATTMAMLLALSACGGSSDGDDASADEAADPAADPAADQGSAGSGGGAGDGSDNAAMVTIGGTTYEFPADPLNLCNSLDDLIFGSYATDAGGRPTTAGGTDVSTQLNFGVPVTDWEERNLQAPIVNVDLVDEGVRWFASVERGLGAVESWQLADGRATGEASFVAEAVGSGEEIGTDTGTFEVVCR